MYHKLTTIPFAHLRAAHNRSNGRQEASSIHYVSATITFLSSRVCLHSVTLFSPLPPLPTRRTNPFTGDGVSRLSFCVPLSLDAWWPVASFFTCSWQRPIQLDQLKQPTCETDHLMNLPPICKGDCHIPEMNCVWSLSLIQSRSWMLILLKTLSRWRSHTVCVHAGREGERETAEMWEECIAVASPTRLITTCNQCVQGQYGIMFYLPVFIDVEMVKCEPLEWSNCRIKYRDTIGWRRSDRHVSHFAIGATDNCRKHVHQTTHLLRSTSCRWIAIRQLLIQRQHHHEQINLLKRKETQKRKPLREDARELSVQLFASLSHFLCLFSVWCTKALGKCSSSASIDRWTL